MLIYICIKLIFLFNKCEGISSPLSPYINYKNSIELQSNVADLWWTIDDFEKEIIFEYHVKTKGWIGLGISPSILFNLIKNIYYLYYSIGGGMIGADIAIGWIDNSGKIYFQVLNLFIYKIIILFLIFKGSLFIELFKTNYW